MVSIDGTKYLCPQQQRRWVGLTHVIQFFQYRQGVIKAIGRAVTQRSLQQTGWVGFCVDRLVKQCAGCGDITGFQRTQRLFRVWQHQFLA